MAELVLINKSDMVAIADAIRSKTGSMSEMNVTEMIENISNISGDNEINKDETNIPKDVIIIDNMELDFTETPFLQITSPAKYPFIMGKSYSVQWNDVTYTTQCAPGGSVYPCAIGNLKLLGLLFGEDEVVDIPDTGEPFLLIFIYGIILAVATSNEHVFTTIRAIDDGIDYIYEIPETIIYPIEYDEELNSSMYMELNNSNNFINIILENNLYKVTLNGVDYEVTGTKQMVNLDGLTGTFICLGNPFYIDSDIFEDNGDPFLIVTMDGMIMASFTGLNESYTVSIIKIGVKDTTASLNETIIQLNEMITQLIEGSIERVNNNTTTEFVTSRFSNHNNLKHVILPNLEVISDSCFSNCSQLSNLIIPKVKTIKFYSFNNCISLTSIEIPELVTIGYGAFSGCSQLENIFSYTIKTIEGQAFNGCNNLSYLGYLDSVENIGMAAFRDCSSLDYISLPSLTSMDTFAFENCTSLKNINIPFLTNIPMSAFEGCSSLIDVNIPNATYLGQTAFKNCTSLQKLDFLNISDFASTPFVGCTSLNTLILRGDTVVSNFDNNLLEDTPIASGEGYIYVKSSLLDSYATRLPWKNYASQIRALENYTVDGTATGALDPNKI